MAFASSTPAIEGGTQGGGSDYANDFQDTDRPEAVEGTEMIYSGGNYHLPISLAVKEPQKTDTRKHASLYTPTERTSAMSFKAPTSLNKKSKQQEATSSMTPFQNVSSYFTSPIKYIASAFLTPTSESEPPLKPGSKKAAWKEEKTSSSKPIKYPEISGTESDSTSGKSLASEDASLGRIRSMKAIDHHGQVAAPSLLDRALAKNKNRSAIVNLSEESFSTKAFTDESKQKARYEAKMTPPQLITMPGGFKKHISPVRKLASSATKNTGRKASASPTSVKGVQKAISASSVKFEMVNRSSYRIVSTSSASRSAQNIIQSSNSNVFQENHSRVQPTNAGLIETEGQPFPLCVPAIGPQQITTTLMSRKLYETPAAPILPLTIETPDGNSFEKGNTNYLPPTILPSFLQERIISTSSSMHDRSNSASTKSPSPPSLTVKQNADTIQSKSPNKALGIAFSPKGFSATKPSKISNNGSKSPPRRTVPVATKGQPTIEAKQEKSRSEYKYPRLVAVQSPPKPAAITPAAAKKSPQKTDVKLSSDPISNLSPKAAKRSPITIKKYSTPLPKPKSPIEKKSITDGAHSLVGKPKSPPQPSPQPPQVSSLIKPQSPDLSAAIAIAASTAIAAAATKLEEFSQKSPPSPFSDRENPPPPLQPSIPDSGTAAVSQSPTGNVLPSPAAPSANSAQTKPPNSPEVPNLQLPLPISPPLSAPLPSPPSSNHSRPILSQMSPTTVNIGSKLPAPTRSFYQSAISVMENSCTLSQYSANPLYFASAATMMGELP